MTGLDQLWDYPNPHILRTRVQAQDIDGLNHTNNAVYVDWCQQAAWDRKLTMARRFQVVRLADGVTLLRAGMRFACIELSSGRPRRLPKEFITGYGPAVPGEAASP